MTPRERLLCVLKGGKPDSVPALADLSWWKAAHGGGKFVPLTTGNEKRLDDLLDLHRQLQVAIHLNLGVFFRESYRGGVRIEVSVDGDTFRQRVITPVGQLSEERQWLASAWSWGISKHMINSAADLAVVRYVFAHVDYRCEWEAYHQVSAKVGELGLPFAQAPYTGMGYLISRYAGIEQTVDLAMDAPEELEATVIAINAAHERVFTLLAGGPAEVLFVSDNLSADVQSPPWFARYSAPYYRRMADIAHAQGKVLSVHIDGRLRGLLGATAQCGIDAADAVTPAPWGDLTPAQCRAEAGDRYVLSGGIPPDSFAEAVPLHVFDEQVEAWLALRRQSPALIIAPGDQLPPSGTLERIIRMRDMAKSATC